MFGPPVALVAALLACACDKKTGASPAPPTSATAQAASFDVLPPPCRRVAAEATCWLRASGNPEEDVERAMASALEVLSKVSASDQVRQCEQAGKSLADRFASAKCTGAELAPAKAGAAPRCATGEFFFIRGDGRIAGCRRECSTDGDCATGARCKGVGSSVGGPTEQPFCEP
ncbi:MAG TPA: hypothetical protein VIY73_13240 [Polyangiaceae bacterium]|jgi:hypothetical protein